MPKEAQAKPIHKKRGSGKRPAAHRLPSRGSFLAKLAASPRFARFFVVFSLAVLFLTTLYWTVLSARLQELNADQFIDPYLFDSWPTFHVALFPGAHTFILKWPLFALMQLFGYHLSVYLAATAIMVLATVGTLAYIIYRIERRPLIFGLMCLALSSVLLLTPAQPYPGALLPVNFAMITTRNLEYAVFVWCLYKVMGLESIRRRLFWLLAGLLALVIASDKLYMVLLFGSFLMILFVSVGLQKRRFELRLAGRLLLLTAVAIGAANLALFAAARSGLTHIINEASSSPYPVIHSLHQLALGSIYGAAALLTVMGANPVHSTIIVQELPADFWHSLRGPTILAYIFNGAVLILGWWAAARVILAKSTDAAARLTTALAGSTLAAAAVFIATDHYYPVDARYVAIELFMVFVALAAYVRGKQLRARFVLAAAVVAVGVLPLGMVQSWHEYAAGQSAMALERHIVATVADVLSRNHIRRLIGDYWKVTPVKAYDGQPLVVEPTDSCVQPHGVLTSSVWYRPDTSTPTAVLATPDANGRTFDGCSLAKLATLYGVPSQRVVLQPDAAQSNAESPLLLVYQNGAKPLTQKDPAAPASSRPSAPKTVSSLSSQAICTGTSLNVVAHQDDDLLFMNPDIAKDIKAGRCERTVYLTAGDAGVDAAYWKNREAGAEAAYAEMLGADNDWQQRRELLDGSYVTVSSLTKAPSVSLVFMRLPDGNLDGAGFIGTHNESLQLLNNGILGSIHTVDDNTSLTKDQLAGMLHDLIETDAPDVIRSLGSSDLADGDHSDHHTAGLLTEQAARQSPKAPAVKLYIGYPDKLQPANLSDEDIAAKMQTFLTYAKHDGAVCQTETDCRQTYTYGHYLTREYTSQNGAAVVPAAPGQAAADIP